MHFDNFGTNHFPLKYLGVAFSIVFFAACENRVEQDVPSHDSQALDKAYEYLDAGQLDSSFLYFDKARYVFLEQNDSVGVAECLVNMAITQQNEDDDFGAHETSLEALRYLNENDVKHHDLLSANYNNLGVSTLKLADYTRSLAFFNLAFKFTTDSLYTVQYHNNLALVYQKREQYDEAIAVYEEFHTHVKGNSLESARILSNLAKTKWLKDQNYPASRDFLKALAIREKEGDLWGMNASYAHLTDYYKTSNPNLAFSYASKMYEVAKKIESERNQIYALAALIELGTGSESKAYFKNYTALSDSLQQKRTKAKNQFAMIRYEVEQNKAQNLQLQNENAEKSHRLTMQRFWTGAIASLSVLLAAGGLMIYKRRKQRIELEAQNKIKAGQLKTSQKVHDVVANGIYRVMIEIEHQPEINRETILNQLEDMYEKSRDISHEAIYTKIQKSYSEQLSSLLRPFASEQRRVLIVGNEADLWINLSFAAQQELLKVLQELMVNMSKHSQAKNVIIRFEQEEKNLKVYYKDDGVGMKKESLKGNGIRNTVSRIESISGTISFAIEQERGVQVNMNIPFS